MSHAVKTGIQTVGVIGAGQMGSGIAQVAAQAAGIQVILHDSQTEQLEKARQAIDFSLSKFVSKENITQTDKEVALSRLQFESAMETLKTCDVVIEAVAENEGLKTEIFQRLDLILPPHALIVSNTSSISITRLAAATKRPHQVMGMHFMNPVPLMKLLELIRGAQTDEATYTAIRELGEQMGKTVVTSLDYPGFISNRVLMPMINEAIFALYEGVGSAEDIDTVMKLGMNHPMGPLQLADFIGLDTCLAILNVLYDGFKDSKYRPCPLLVQKVNAGYLGKKSGQGFFNYSG